VLLGISQEKNCDIIFHKAFYNFVTYDDSVGYSLDYHFLDKLSCLEDTVDFMHFLLSDRYITANSNAIRMDSNYLSTHPMSYLACHTNHRKTSSCPNIMEGKGSQWTIMVPVEILQLYFVSALYYNDFEFRKEIVLVKENKTVMAISNLKHNEQAGESSIVETVNISVLKKAKKSYLKWLQLVDSKGLNYIRQNEIDPLSFAKNIEWR